MGNIVLLGIGARFYSPSMMGEKTGLKASHRLRMANHGWIVQTMPQSLSLGK
tara:strand:- start:170 stop:325 length:156 start_codon:yes stop_codon:yes gene_type:complete